MQYDFFGTHADILEVWRWLHAVPGIKVFERSSKSDHPNRWFKTIDEIAKYLSDGHQNGGGGTWTLAAWPESVGGKPVTESVTFTPEAQKELGGYGRTDLQSPALITITRNNDQNGCLANASMSCWTEKGARQRSVYAEEFFNEVDWRQFHSIVGKLQRQIAKHSPAKMRSCPVMPDAFAKLKVGEIRLWNWGEPCDIDSPLITVK